jgi:hypothetical protein
LIRGDILAVFDANAPGIETFTPKILQTAFQTGSERSGPRQRTAGILTALGSWNETFALRLFPGELARASDGLALLAILALGRLLIGLSALHFTKNALALHLLLEDPKCLIDIVVANKYLQMFSNLAEFVSVIIQTKLERR